jgi:hypothetical protein
VYARTVGDRELTFGVSGMLYRDALIMYDRETDTLWTHVGGQAIRGELQGRQLEIVPAVHATWKEWKTLYPESLVLKKRGIDNSAYEAYNRDQQTLGIFGRRHTDERLPAKERILGVMAEGEAVAFPIARLREARLVETSVGPLAVLLVAPAGDVPVLAYNRHVAGRTLTFELGGGAPPALRDRETGSTWRLADGVATAGDLQGSRLERVPAHPAFWFGWRNYFPRSEVWPVRQDP